MPLSVDTQFSSLMDDAVALSGYISEYLRGINTQLQWMIPTGITPAWVFEPTTIADLGDPFDRTAPNSAYSDEYTGSGSSTNEVRAVMGKHMEINYMGMMERAFRERHRTSVRAGQLAAGRRNAHADSSYGIHKRGIQGYIQTLLNS